MQEVPRKTLRRLAALLEQPGYLEARLQAADSMDVLKEQLLELLEICREREPERLLADFTTLSGFSSTVDRYDMGVIGARFAPYVPRAAILVTPDFLDPNKFGVRVAQNRGLNVDVFLDREEALAWLLA